ncbi:MAG: molybdopterin converting factor subunit 1 [Gemmataceae bacterium]
MNVRVYLFARAKELAGTDSVTLEFDEGAKVDELRKILVARFPELEDFLGRCAVAVGSDYATNDTLLSPDVDVAVLPPVSGGCD